MFVVCAWAEPLLEGRVRLESGQPVADAQVQLFDLTNLRQGAIARAMTDGTGYFALPLATPTGRALPARFALGPNYPNPFNPSTIIPYQLPTTMHVRLEVFNILGQHIATLVDGERSGGFHTVGWDATNVAGQAMAAGVYFYRLGGAGVHVTRRMVLIDGQAGVPAAGGGGLGAVGEAEAETVPVYGLVVSGRGLVPYVDPGFRVETGGGLVDLVVEPLDSVPRAEAMATGILGDVGNVEASGGLVDLVVEPLDSVPRAEAMATGILGDVGNNGQVDLSDALLVALYSGDASVVMPNNGAISLGDVNADGQVDLSDAWLIAAWVNDLSDPPLPAGSGKPVAAATTSQEKLYWTDFGTDKIQCSNLDGSEVEDLVTTGLRSPLGLALDMANGKLYWTDFGTDKIQRSNLDGSEVEDLVTTGLRSPRGLALDMADGKLYWTDSGTDKIQRSNLDGSEVEDLVTTGLRSPRGLALDMADGKLYWTDFDTDKIQRSNLDGSEVEDLVTTGLESPYGLALDVAGGKLYWTDSGTDKIQRSNLDGSGVEDLVTTGLRSPRGLALDVAGGRLYWTDSGTDKIQRSNLDGSGVEDLVTTGLENPFGLALDVSDSGTTYGAGETLPNYPSGFFVPRILSGASLSSSGGRTILGFNNGGFVELQDGTRYTCIASGGCSIEGGRVTSGTIRVTTGEGGDDSGDDDGGSEGSSDDHSNTRSGATNLAQDSSLAGEIETGDDVDYFKVQVSESGTLTIYTTGSLDTTGRLESSSGSTLTSNDDGGRGYNFRIERSVSAGTYYVRVESYSSRTGSYTLHASFESSSSGDGGDSYTDGGDAMTILSIDCEATSTTIGARVTVEGTIRANRDVKNVRGWLTINGQAISGGVPAPPDPIRGGYLWGGRSLGDFSAGQTKSYRITESFIGGVSGLCGVTFWFEEE